MEWEKTRRIRIRKMNKQFDEAEENGEMSLSGHLRELRNRILVYVIALVAAILIGLHYAADIVEKFLDIGAGYDYQFVYIAPQELMIQYFFVAFVFGICITFPILVYQVWAFIRPGLKKSENTLFLFAIVCGLLCFCVGAAFAYKVMLPFMLYFFVTLGTGSGISAYISIQNYLSFLLTVLIIFGIVFELPVVSMILNFLGLLKVQWMKSGRRVVIVLIFVVAAIITPPDIVSQTLVALPMIVLYEISIILCTFCQKVTGRKN